MAETADDLSTPLGQKTVRRKRRFRLPFTAMQVLAVLLGLFLVTFAGFAIFNDNPLGGEPVARVALRQPTPATKSLPRCPQPRRTRRKPPPSRPRRASRRPSPSSTAQRQAPGRRDRRWREPPDKAEGDAAAAPP